jgi:mRNA interferase RelE/StbE
MGVVYEVLYDPRVSKEDLPSIDTAWRHEIEKAILQKLTSHPSLYGKPLRAPLSGFRKIRVGDYRVIFTIGEKTVIIFFIAHRKDVYKHMLARIQKV